MSRHHWLWMAGLLVGCAAALVVLQRRRALTAPAAMALVFAGVGLFVGAKWQYRLEQGLGLHALTLWPSDLSGAGYRLPLGLLLGTLFAGFYSWIIGQRLRVVGDALAVAAAAMMSIGRIGCFLHPCCMGTTCAGWLSALCLRYPPGTEAYHAQLASGQIPLGSRLSLPAYPVPLYYAGLSLALLVLLGWLIHRGAKPGIPLAAFSLLYAAATLGLEHLRASTPEGPTGLMLAIPLVALFITSAVLGAAFLVKRSTSQEECAGTRQRQFNADDRDPQDR